MIKPVNDKVYTNEHPKVDRVDPERIEVAGSTSNKLLYYNKWKKLYESGGNMRKNLPIEITNQDLKLFLKIYNKRNK